MDVKPGYKLTEVGVIPQDWNVVPLGQLVRSVEYGSSAKSSTSGRVPVLRMGNLQEGMIDWDGLVYTDNPAEISKYTLRDGDVLFNRTNTIDLVGKTAIYRGEQPAIFAGYLIRINVDPALLDSRYLNRVLNTEVARKYSLKVLSVAVGQANINGQKLKTYPIPLPPTRAEQEAIAGALSDADALIESLEQLVVKKRQIKHGAMQELLTGQKRLPGFTGEWEMKHIRDVVSTPITDGPHLTPKFLADGVPFLSVNNLVDNRIDLQSLRYVSKADHLEFSKKCKPRKGDILFGKAASVGMVAVIETDMELNIWSPLALIRVTPPASARFVYYALQASHVRLQIKLLTNSSSQGNIGMSEVGLLRIPLPEPDEQAAIAAVLSDMDTEVAAVETRLAKARQVKQGMMQELLTGRIRLI